LVLYEKTSESTSPSFFGKCLEKDLEASKMFTSVDFFPTWDPLAEKFQKYDIIIGGSLENDKRPVYHSLYGLSSPIGILLSFILPTKFVHREVSFEVNAIVPTMPYEEFWKEIISFVEPARSASLFGQHSISEFDHCPTENLQPKFLEIRKSLTQAIRGNSAIFNKTSDLGQKREGNL